MFLYFLLMDFLFVLDREKSLISCFLLPENMLFKYKLW